MFNDEGIPLTWAYFDFIRDAGAKVGTGDSTSEKAAAAAAAKAEEARQVRAAEIADAEERRPDLSRPGATYSGPVTSSKTTKEVLELLQNLFRLPR